MNVNGHCAAYLEDMLFYFVFDAQYLFEATKRMKKRAKRLLFISLSS